MTDSLYIASTGMHTQQEQINIISNNLANVSTPAFKKSKISFIDLMYREVNEQNKGVPFMNASYEVGAGAAISGTNKVFTMGEVKATDRSLDVAINGDGFIEVELLDGTRAYTRNGGLQINEESLLTTNDGFVLSSSIQVPEDASDIVISEDGRVQVAIPDESGLIEVGQIELVKFVSAENLKSLGNNLYVPTGDSGDAIVGTAGNDGLGTLQQGFLESSNVNLVEELVSLILAQRAYEINSKVIQASDEMLTLSNNMRR